MAFSLSLVVLSLSSVFGSEVDPDLRFFAAVVLVLDGVVARMSGKKVRTKTGFVRARRQRSGRSSMLARRRWTASPSGCQRPPPMKLLPGSAWM